MFLSISITLLCESDNTKRIEYLEDAQNLLHYFVHNAKFHYGSLFTVYNVHSIVHLCEDVKHYKVSLHDMSAFPFENYLQRLKKFVRGTQNPLVQICKRLDELEGILYEGKCCINKIDVGIKNSCFTIKNGIVFVKEIMANGILFCNYFSDNLLVNFFDDLVESKKVGIYLIRRNIQPIQCTIKRKNLCRKCVCLPFKDGNVVLSILQDFVWCFLFPCLSM